MTTTTSGGGVDAASGDGPASRSLLLLELKRASTRAIAPVDLHYIHCDLAFPSSCPRPAHLGTRPPTASLEGHPPVRHVLATPLDRLDSMTFWDDRHRSGHCTVSQCRLGSALFSLLFSFCPAWSWHPTYSHTQARTFSTCIFPAALVSLLSVSDLVVGWWWLWPPTPPPSHPVVKVPRWVGDSEHSGFFRLPGLGECGWWWVECHGEVGNQSEDGGDLHGSWSGTWTQDSAALSKAGVSGLLRGSRRRHPPVTLVGFLHLHVYRVVSR